MAKVKQWVRLVDAEGTVWANAELSDSRLTALLKSYALAGIDLTVDKVA